MLNACAPGHRVVEKTHAYWVLYNRLTYFTLPKYSEIPVGHVRKTIRSLGIDMECAKNHLPVLNR